MYEVMSKESFMALSVMERRKLLLEDVILQVSLNHITPVTGTFATHRGKEGGGLFDLDGKLDVTCPVAKAVLLDGSCHVCAKGAMFVAALMRTDNYTVHDFRGGHGQGRIHERVTCDLGVFTEDQMDSMEHAFEGWGVDNSEADDDSLSTDVVSDKYGFLNFFQVFDDEGERLVAICMNILENHGYFVTKNAISREQVLARIEKAKTTYAHERVC